MSIPFWQVDAFTDHPFAGNSAAVCLLDTEKESSWMQQVAMEMNLSETSFVWRTQSGDQATFQLRWFTPEVEVDLCGHATLAAAHALWTEGIVSVSESIAFQTISGTLICSRKGIFIALDFPAIPVEEANAPEGLLDGLGVPATFVGRTRFDHLVEVVNESIVREARPDFQRLSAVRTRGVMLTARSDNADYDFVSRFFAPAVGINEDPVTGSAHCSLGPYWGKILGKQTLRGYQASKRGGVVSVEIREDRVSLGGTAVTVLRGELLH